MVSVIILYDHVSPQGAFHKNSAINVRVSLEARMAVELQVADQTSHTAPLVPTPRAGRPLAQMKSSIKLIQAQGPGEQTDSLLNALRYTTKHMADADTPKQIKQLLA